MYVYTNTMYAVIYTYTYTHHTYTVPAVQLEAELDHQRLPGPARPLPLFPHR